MDKLIENEELLTEFAKTIFRDVEKYISEHDNFFENTTNLDNK